MNTFRKQKRVLTDAEKDSIDHIISHAECIEATIVAVKDRTGPSRELAVAMTKLEEAVMWAVKGITA